MSNLNANLSAATSFNVRPARSQVVLVSLTVMAIVAVLLGGILLAMDKTGGWIFVVLSAALCAAVVWCWRQSQRDTDLAQSHATQLVMADGTNISTDSRLLGSPEAFQNFAKLIAAFASLQPLPEPSGLAGPGGILIPNSQQKAIEIVDGINANTQRSHNEVLSQLQKQVSPSAMVQLPLDEKGQPPASEAGIELPNSLKKEP